MNTINFSLFTLLLCINIWHGSSVIINCGSTWEDCRGEVITCTPNQDCTVRCREEAACENTIIYGNNANNLYVDVSASGSELLEVYCDVISNGNCEITCQEDDACRRLHVYGNNKTQIESLKVTGGDPQCCLGGYESSIRYGIINCGSTKNCMILCNDIDSCENTLIYGENALNLIIEGNNENSLRDSIIDCGNNELIDKSLCRIDCYGDMSCYLTNVYCGSVKKCDINCRVSDSCYRNKFYGNNTLSLEISGKESYSIDGSYIDCGSNNENECILDCDDDSSCLYIDVKTSLSKQFSFNYGDSGRGKRVILDTTSPVYSCTNSPGASTALPTLLPITTTAIPTKAPVASVYDTTVGVSTDEPEEISGRIECINVESDLNRRIGSVKCPVNDNYVITGCGAITTNNAVFSTYIRNETCWAEARRVVKASARCCKIVQ